MSFTATIDAEISSFVKNISKAQARMDAFAEEVGKQVAEIGRTMQSIGGALSIGVTAPLTALGAASLKAFGDVESLKNGLIALTGSADEAGRQMARLTKLTDIPGLSLEALTKGSINLQTIGFSAEKAEKAMAGLGNAIALVGGGQQDFEGALYGLQQLANTEFPLGEDLNILKERLPQITPLLRDTFGTARTEELQKLKVTSAQVVDTIIAGLDKLPKAAVGFNGALSQIRNTITVALADIGETINKTFDVTGALQSLKSSLQSATEWFKNLSPEARKAIVVIGGLAAAIGPLLVAIGGLLQLAPLVGTAFAVITGPVGAAVAAVGLAVAGIIKYWDEIKDYFTTGQGGKFWDSIKNAATSLWNSLKSIFGTIRSFVIDIWDRIGDNVVSTVQSAFGTVLSVVNYVVTNITNILNIFAALLKGDWRGVLNGFGQLFKDIFKGIVSIVTGAVQTMTNALASFFNLIGATGIASGLENLSNYLDRFTVSGSGAAKATTLVADALPKLSSKSNEAIKPVGSLGDAVNKTASEISNLKLQLEGTLMSEWGRQLFEINNKYDAIVKKYGGNKDILNLASQARQAELFRTKISQITEEIGKSQKQNKDGIIPNMEFTIPDMLSGLEKKIDINASRFKNLLAKLKTPFEETSNAISDIMGNGLVSVISNSMSALGEALATGGNILGAIGKSLIGTLGGLAKQIGEQMIAFGTAGLALKFMVSNPFLAIAAGAALVALGSFAQSSVSKTLETGTKGGYFGYQSQDYSSFRGAYYNNDRTQTVDFRIKGNDLLGSLNINNNRNNRLS